MQASMHKAETQLKVKLLNIRKREISEQGVLAGAKAHFTMTRVTHATPVQAGIQ